MLRKPVVNPTCVADKYAGPHEQIIEFSNGTRAQRSLKGGLISFRNRSDGTLEVQLYRLDPDVKVDVEDGHLVDLSR